jgi:hypothetical protein
MTMFTSPYCAKLYHSVPSVKKGIASKESIPPAYICSLAGQSPDF